MKQIYSGKQIIKAGEALISNDIFLDKNKAEFEISMNILSYWRFSHQSPLDHAFRIVQSVSIKIDKHAYYAKRLKRHVSIFHKLRRYEGMKLKNMNDIGGCRIILSNEKKLYQVVRSLKKLAVFKYEGNKYRYKDYIKHPKNDGYRSYHLIGKFPDNQNSSKCIEIQLRTQMQHYWATALEIVDLFTDQALKSNQGDEIWSEFFRQISHQFSIMDKIHMFNTFKSNKKLTKYKEALNKENNTDKMESCLTTQKLSKQLNVVENLQAFADSLRIINKRLDGVNDAGYVLLKIDTIKATVTSKLFSTEDNIEAEEEYIQAEKDISHKKGIVIALVSTGHLGDIKEAYPNYFADSTEFLNHLMLISAINFY